MEDVVAVRLEMGDGGRRYFLTWGRIFGAVDPTYLEELVLRHCRRFALHGEPVAAVVCRTLREAAESEQALYFHEHLLWFSWHPIPFGPGYEAWRAEREDAMERGQELLFCGTLWTVDGPPGGNG